MTPKAQDIKEAIVSVATPEKARILQYFFKTGEGQYGAGDHFLGVKNPEVRLVVKTARKEVSLEDATCLVKDKWHEVRLCGLLLMVELFHQAKKKKDADEMTRIYKKYISLHEFVNNWDLVDLSAGKIVGEYEALFPEEGLMDEWIKPGHTLWQRRIAMVCCWGHTGRNDFGKVLSRAEMLLDSGEDLLNKAAGWMLREVFKESEEGSDMVRQFLENHVKGIPSIMLSYICEKMDEEERRYWRQLRK
ncbi:MAG: DNA alkylation repair protein [Bacteroidales bacterium]|nr:DNA alkylation repair protein [Bacteroidales bacterium]